MLVQGIGAVGLSTIALARLAGASHVIAIGGPIDRAPLAAAMGADVVLDLDATSPEERAARVRELTGGRGADMSIEAAGSPRAVEEALDWCATAASTSSPATTPTRDRGHQRP